MGTTFTEIRTMGWRALVKELGYSGATKFILLYEKGEGDYTEERKELFKDITIEDIAWEIKEMQKVSSVYVFQKIGGEIYNNDNK